MKNANSTTLLPAKTCYNHIGGKLGHLLLEAFITKGWIKQMHAKDKHLSITKKGEKEFSKMGINLSELPAEK